MKISVVIPNYNDPRIRRAIESIRAQTYPNVELVVVDGLSGNPEVNEIYEHYPIDRLIQEKDEGIFDALNKGVKVATGDIVYLMGSDDFLPDPDTFQTVIDTLEADSRLDGVTIGCEFSNARGKIIRKWYPKQVTSNQIKKGILPPHFSLFLKKRLYPLVGEFKHNEFGNTACDTIWLIDLALAKPDLHIGVLRSKHLVMEYGGSSTGSVMGTFRQYRVIHNYAKRRELSAWYLLPLFKVASKVLQLRPF